MTVVPLLRSTLAAHGIDVTNLSDDELAERVAEAGRRWQGMGVSFEEAARGFDDGMRRLREWWGVSVGECAGGAH